MRASGGRRRREVVVDTVEAATTFFGLLTLATNVLVVGLVAVWVGGRWSDRLGTWRGVVRAQPVTSFNGLAWAIATVATLGSLYYSDVVGFPPCLLCWYQRIAMYPLVIILGVAALRRVRDTAWYAVPLAGIGAGIAAYHYLLEWFPRIDVGACTAEVPCSVAWFRTFGFVSLPYMALSGFLAVIVLTLIATRAGADGSDASDALEEHPR